MILLRISNLLLTVTLLLLLGCGGNNTPDTANPNLLTANLTFRLPGNAKQRYKQLVTGTSLAKHFKQSPLNIYYKHENQQWTGRIRENDVSYHALFSIDDSQITASTLNSNAAGLHFSIYHPGGSVLTYGVSMGTGDNKKKVFEKTFDTKRFFDGYISFDEPFKNGITVTFETRGRGIGAWVNPRFHEVKKKPRVFIVMVLDTLRYDHTSVYGYHRKTTPNLEQLAGDGVKFDRAYSSTSWTLPSHVSLFSGKDLSEHGVIGPGDLISTDYPLAAEVFQEQGFLTAAFTGGGFVEDSYGFYRGFQYYSNAPGNVFSMNSADRVFNHFKNYMERFWGNDLFIFLHTYQIHAPYKAPRRYVDRINKDLEGNLLGVSNFLKQKHEYFKPLQETDRQRLIDLYDASILYTDDALLGNVMRLLKEKGLYEQSMIAVLSDHGEEFYDHGSWEHGHGLYNELIKIPMVVKFPFSKTGKNRGRVEEGLASITDIPGMMLGESGFEYDKDIFSVGFGQSDRRLPVSFPVSPTIKQFPVKFSFLEGRFHFIYNHIDKEKPEFFNPAPKKIPVYELYDIDDMHEKHNLYKKNFQRVHQFKKPLQLYLNKLKQLKRKGKKIDKELENKLKSLGYLGN
ncbi:MAG: sulfatase [bacterium]|nr:sulfatase [bacterium]